MKTAFISANTKFQHSFDLHDELNSKPSWRVSYICGDAYICKIRVICSQRDYGELSPNNFGWPQCWDSKLGKHNLNTCGTWALGNNDLAELYFTRNFRLCNLAGECDFGKISLANLRINLGNLVCQKSTSQMVWCWIHALMPHASHHANFLTFSIFVRFLMLCLGL